MVNVFYVPAAHRGRQIYVVLIVFLVPDTWCYPDISSCRLHVVQIPCYHGYRDAVTVDTVQIGRVASVFLFGMDIRSSEKLIQGTIDMKRHKFLPTSERE